jgi:hypothetical protein
MATQYMLADLRMLIELRLTSHLRPDTVLMLCDVAVATNGTRAATCIHRVREKVSLLCRMHTHTHTHTH